MTGANIHSILWEFICDLHPNLGGVIPSKIGPPGNYFFWTEVGFLDSEKFCDLLQHTVNLCRLGNSSQSRQIKLIILILCFNKVGLVD